MHAGAVQKEGEALSGTVLQSLAEDYPLPAALAAAAPVIVR